MEVQYNLPCRLQGYLTLGLLGHGSTVQHAYYDYFAREGTEGGRGGGVYFTVERFHKGITTGLGAPKIKIRVRKLTLLWSVF